MLGLEPAVWAVLVVLLLVLFSGRFDAFSTWQAKPCLAASDRLQYRVHMSHENPQQAAEMMARLNNLLIDVQQYMKRKFVQGGEGTPEQQAMVTRILARYNYDNLVENSHKDPAGDTSYSLNKGSLLAFCVRDRQTGQLHDYPVLAFVALHELAHLSIDEYNHPPKFWRAFRFVLEQAAEGGIYRSPNFAQHPVQYCGMTVNYNPVYDPGMS